MFVSSKLTSKLASKNIRLNRARITAFCDVTQYSLVDRLLRNINMYPILIWKCARVWERHWQINISFKRKLRVDWSWVMLATIQSRTFCLLEYKNYHFARGSVWVWNLVSNIKGGTQTEGVWEQGVEDNIWTEGTFSDRRLEKTT
jgi:hypothetical protein